MFISLLYHFINIVPLFGDKSEAPAPLTTTNDPLKSISRAFKEVFACCFSGGLLGWDVFLNSLFRVGFTRGFFFVVSVYTLLFLFIFVFSCFCFVNAMFGEAHPKQWLSYTNLYQILICCWLILFFVFFVCERDVLMKST